MTGSETVLPSKSEFQQLAYTRLHEAEALYAAGFYTGAYYLAGYVLELALKACICKKLDVEDYPQREFGGGFKTHNFNDLVLLAGLTRALEARRSIETLDRSGSSVPVFARNWDIVTTWGPDKRYELSTIQRDAERMLDAIRTDPDGVLTWLSNQW